MDEDSDEDEDSNGAENGSDDSDDAMDEDDIIFLPPSAKRRKLLLSVTVMQHLQRLGTGEHGDDEDEDSEEDEESSSEAVGLDTIALLHAHTPPSKSGPTHNLTPMAKSKPAMTPSPSIGTRPASGSPATPSFGRKKVSFDMNKVHVQEFDKRDSPSTVQSPRARTGTSAPGILKPPRTSVPSLKFNM